MAQFGIRSWFAVVALTTCTGQAQLVSISANCTVTTPFTPFWRSVGYTPAELALQYDEAENMAIIGATPLRGVEQIRVHYMMDLLVTTSWNADPSSPSGWRVGYVWDLLDSATDWLIQNQLTLGFELMGSPVGFPQLPVSFWETSSGNGKLLTNDTATLWRQVVADTLVHYAERYGATEAQAVRWETWNEPDSGWGWQLPPNNATNVAGYVSYFDATGAGVSDAEASTGLRFELWGPASGKGAGDKRFLPAVFEHYSTGTNMWTGGPVRLDGITVHSKGQGTSYLVMEGEWSASALIRANATWAASKLPSLALSNDEADPLVGWATPEDWRGDARYAAIMGKIVAQHLGGIAENATGGLNNPLGLLSFDAGFMNTLPTFGQRTMTAKLTDATGARVGFVRKTGLSAFAALSRVGDALCGAAAVVPPSEPLFGNYGAFVTTRAAGPAPDSAAQATVVLYNSADCSNATSPGLSPTLSLAGLPFATGDPSVRVAAYQLDDALGNTAAAWAAMGSPATPSSEQLQALWAAGPLSMAAPPQPVVVGDGGAVSFAAPALPLPGLAVYHFSASPASPPLPPVGVVAYAKSPAASLLDPKQCDAVRGAPAGTYVPSRSTAGYVVQYSPTAPPAAAWQTISAATGTQDVACMLYHAAPPPPPAAVRAAAAPHLFAAWYRVAGVDYWGRTGNWSDAGAAVPLPGSTPAPN